MKEYVLILSPVKRAFYSACNSISSHGSGVEKKKISLLHLYRRRINSHCICRHCCDIVGQINELNVCWNMAIYRIFAYRKWDSVGAAIDGLSILFILCWLCCLFLFLCLLLFVTYTVWFVCRITDRDTTIEVHSCIVKMQLPKAFLRFFAKRNRSSDVSGL